MTLQTHLPLTICRKEVKAIKTLVLSCRQVSKSYGSHPVLQDVNLDLYRGELVSVLGQSGSGKTTLFNILTGLDQDAGGVINRPDRVGYMLQKDTLLPWKRLVDNVALPLLLAGMSKKEARDQAAGYFELFGLKGLEYRYPRQLSGGQSRRAGFLRTYLYSRDVMLLDEPFVGLDPITAGQLYDWLGATKEELGLSILLITHRMEEAMILSDRIYVLGQGPPSSLWPSLQVPEEARTSDAMSKAGLLHLIHQRLFTLPSETEMDRSLVIPSRGQ